MNIAVIIVTYHTKTEELNRLKEQWNSISPVTFFITDNSDNQKGYAYGINQGLRKAYEKGFTLFVVCNPDIDIQGLTEQILRKASEHFYIFGFTMDQNGTVFYGGIIDPLRYSGGLSQKKPAVDFSPVDFVTGSLMGISRKAIETIGFYDESYGMYYEDVDYCHRAKKAGLSVGMYSGFTYKHSETSRTNLQKDRYLAINRFRFFLRYASLRAKLFEFIRSPLTLFEYCQLFFGKAKLNH